MKDMLLALLVLAISLFRCAESGSICPPLKGTDCFCSSHGDGATVVVCYGISNTSHLEEVTKSLKSLIVDRFVVLNAYSGYHATLGDSENVTVEAPKGKIPPTPSNGILPKKWLSEMRVREVDIQNAELTGFFLTDDAFEGQSEFLTSLVVKNAYLKGHLCSSCAPGFFTVSTKALRRTPLLKHVDLSHNQLEVLDGSVFPSNLKLLTRISLADNHITRVHDNAFASLHQLKHLDLSRNRLTTVSRKIVRAPSDSMLTTLDLSYNSIQALPEDMFSSMSALREVKMSHNLIESLPSETWNRAGGLEKIDLRGNFLVCNCSSSWIARRMGKNTKLLGHCIAPKDVEFQEVKATTPTLITCRE